MSSIILSASGTPAAPRNDEIRMFNRAGQLWIKTSNGRETLLSGFSISQDPAPRLSNDLSCTNQYRVIEMPEPESLGDAVNLRWASTRVVPTGAQLQMGVRDPVPTGYVAADGTVYDVSAYPDLAARYGDTYGGDGVTTFGVPDQAGVIIKV